MFPIEFFVTIIFTANIIARIIIIATFTRVCPFYTFIYSRISHILRFTFFCVSKKVYLFFVTPTKRRFRKCCYSPFLVVENVDGVCYVAFADGAFGGILPVLKVFRDRFGLFAGTARRIGAIACFFAGAARRIGTFVCFAGAARRIGAIACFFARTAGGLVFYTGTTREFGAFVCFAAGTAREFGFFVELAYGTAGIIPAGNEEKRKEE
jgi:hypothetical protein